MAYVGWGPMRIWRTCTKMSTRSSFGSRLTRPSTAASFTPTAPPPGSSMPSWPTGMTHEGRAGAWQAGCSKQSCSAKPRGAAVTPVGARSAAFLEPKILHEFSVCVCVCDATFFYDHSQSISNCLILQVSP